MQYFDPETIAPEILKKAGISRLAPLKISPEPHSKPLDCLNNVRKFLDKNCGEVQFGWILTIFGNIGLQLTAHAVVKQSGQPLVCVTLDESREGRVKFAPDSQIQSLIKNNFLPVKFIPLTESDVLRDYLALMQKANDVRVNRSCIFVDPMKQLEAINNEATLLYPEILALAKTVTLNRHQLTRHYSAS